MGWQDPNGRSEKSWSRQQMEAEGKTKRPKRNLEEQHQTAYFTRIRAQVARFPELRWIHASQNGMYTGSAAAAGKAKAAGMTAGVFDICIPVPMRGYHGCWIELKIKPNKLTPEQSEFQADMTEKGYYCPVAWSVDDLIALTAAYLEIDLR